tara:strand:+ start:471 stop:1085 length:615 start_codon:yes stop_codon:yes gene_type:complete
MNNEQISIRKKDISPDTFIQGYYMPKNVCDEIWKFYENNNHLTGKGLVGDNKVDLKTKDSTELGIHKDFEYFPMNIYKDFLFKCLEDYIENTYDSLKHINLTLEEGYNIQYYTPGGGFKKWHYERDNKVRAKRVLVFMTYLNDVDNGGTEFKYQKLQIPAEKGLTLIWPTEFTHTHRGIISPDKEKMIVTGWLETCTIENNEVK